MSPSVVAFHNPRMIYSPALNLRGLDDQRTFGEIFQKLPVCDQTDATYRILHGFGDDDENEFPAYLLAEPLGDIPAEERARLEHRLRFEEGFLAVYMPQELPPEDYFRLCINDCWTADLAEPYVLVYDFDAHVAVALDDLLVLKGPVLDHEQPGQWGLQRLALPLITQNREQMLADFRAIEWLKQHRYGKSYQLTEEGIFKFKEDFELDHIRWP